MTAASVNPTPLSLRRPDLEIPRRILMTADTVGGVWTYTVELCRALAPFGIRVHVATMGEAVSEAQHREASDVRNLELHESDFRLEWMTDPWDDVAEAGEWLLELERQVRPDIVHLNGYAHASLPWSVPRLVVGHSCVYSWFEAVRGTIPDPDEWKPYRVAVTHGLRAADAVTAPTAAMLQALHHHYGSFPSAPVVFNGRRAADFPPGDKQPLILTAGRVWDEAKNIAALARVAPKLPWEVQVAGEAQHPDGGTNQIDGLTPLGRLDRHALAAAYRRASVFCLPARYEPFGLCPLEAALAGCALVLGDIPSLREIWEDTAVFVPPTDEAALQRALTRLIEDDQQRLQLAARSRLRALTFSPEATAQGYLHVYDRLLRRAGRIDRGRPRTRTVARPIISTS